MKKVFNFNIMGWVVSAALLIGYIPGCNNANPPQNDASISCDTCSSKLFPGINYTDLIDGVHRYRDMQSTIINRQMNVDLKADGKFEDARSCWYSIDTLKNFICLAEKYSKILGMSGDTLGIRFYYATYDKNPSIPYSASSPASPIAGLNGYGLHHTLFMVPTFRNYLSQDLDFDPRLTLLKHFPNLTEELIMQQKVQMHLTNNDTSIYTLNKIATVAPTTFLLSLGHIVVSTPGAQNQGKLCPPTCDPNILAN